MEKENKAEPMDPRAARAVLDHEKQERARKCGDAIQKACQEYNCELIAVPVIAPDGRIIAQVQVRAND